MLVLTVLRPDGIVDLSNNTLKTQMMSTAVYKYQYISSDVKVAASNTGQASFYGMLLSLGLSLGLSFIL
jgi:hypothetical protein